jgi:hypothetical protein
MQISNCRNWKEDEILDLQKMNENEIPIGFVKAVF